MLIASHTQRPRYAIGAFPYIELGAAAIIVACQSRLRGARGMVVAAALSGLALSVQLPASLKLVRSGLLESTRIESTRWIEDHIPDGATIVLDIAGPFVNVREDDGDVEVRSHTGSHASFVNLPRERNDQMLALHGMDDFVATPDPRRLLAENRVEWVVTNSDSRDRWWSAPYLRKVPNKSRQQQEFYEWLDARAERVKTFDRGFALGENTHQLSNPCPRIDVYRIDWNSIPESEIESLRRLP